MKSVTGAFDSLYEGVVRCSRCSTVCVIESHDVRLRVHAVSSCWCRDDSADSKNAFGPISNCCMQTK